MSNYSKTTDFEAKDSLPTGDSGKIIRGAEFETEFDAISTAIATKADTAGPTFTGTLTFETISDGTIGVTAFVDEDDMSSDSATLVPTQQSVKAYVDSQVTAQDLDFQADSGGALSIDLDSETLTFTGGTGVDTSGSGNAVTFAIDSTVATLTGTQTLTNKTLTSPDVNTPDIDGGTIDGTVIGGTTPAAVSATTVSATGNITVGGTVDGRDIATDGTKLDGIESGATADQTAAEIRTLVESATDSNVFTDADHTKLDGIEAGATGDQTNAEIRAAVEAATDSNVFTDADHSKLDGIEALADVTDTTNVTAAGAVMDSELTNETAVKSLDQGVATTDTPTFAGLATSANVTFGDNDKAIFGAGSDLQIYHDGSASYIADTGTGTLNIKASGSIRLRGNDTDELLARFNENGSNQFYYDSAEKLATTSTGIDVTGTVTASSGASTFNSDSSANTVNFDGRSSDNISQLNFRPNGGASNYSQIQSRSTELFVKTIANIPMSLHTNNTERLGIANNGDISFYEDTGTTAKLTWSAANESLEIDGQIGITNFDALKLGTAHGGGASIAYAGDGNLKVNPRSGFSTVFESGNVGIGSSSVRAKLDIVSSTSATPTDFNASSIFIEETGNNKYAGLTFLGGNNLGNTGTVAKLLVQNTNTAGGFEGAMMFSTRNSSSSMVERMRIDSSGKVGINSQSPVAILACENTGSLTIDSNDGDHTGFGLFVGKESFSANTVNTAIGFGRPSSGRKYAAIGVQTYSDPDQNGLNFYVQETSGGGSAQLSEAMRITYQGNVLVGKTGTSFSTAGSRLTPDGGGQFIVNEAACIEVNRLSNDGILVGLYKDGSAVGAISTYGSGLVVGNANSSAYANIRFTNNEVFPCTTSGGNNDDAIDLGKNNSRYRDIYAGNGTINTSDRNEKQDIEELSDAEQRVAVACKGLLRKFRWKSSVADKGDDARIHFGIIAQDLQAAFEAEGLDAGRYGMFINSTWTDEETGEERSRMGVRYSELLAFIIAAI